MQISDRHWLAIAGTRSLHQISRFSHSPANVLRKTFDTGEEMGLGFNEMRMRNEQ